MTALPPRSHLLLVINRMVEALDSEPAQALECIKAAREYLDDAEAGLLAEASGAFDPIVFVDIEELDKADVLRVLFNAARDPCGGNPRMTHSYAAQLIARVSMFNYLEVKTLFIDLTHEYFSPGDYDAANGEGLAQKTIDELRKAGR